MYKITYMIFDPRAHKRFPVAVLERSRSELRISQIERYGSISRDVQAFRNGPCLPRGPGTTQDLVYVTLQLIRPGRIPGVCYRMADVLCYATPNNYAHSTPDALSIYIITSGLLEPPLCLPASNLCVPSYLSPRGCQLSVGALWFFRLVFGYCFGYLSALIYVLSSNQATELDFFVKRCMYHISVRTGVGCIRDMKMCRF